MRGSEKVVKKKTIYLFFAAVVLFAILEPTAFIGTWVHSFCGYIRSASFFCCVVVYLLIGSIRRWKAILFCFFWSSLELRRFPIREV